MLSRGAGTWTGLLASAIVNGRYWFYQDFVAGSGTAITITDNENGTGLAFDATKIINNSAVVTDTNGNPIFSSTTEIPANEVSVSVHTAAAVTLNAIPDASFGTVRIWYLYRESTGALPTNMEVAPDFVKAVRIQWLDTHFLNQNSNLSDLTSVTTALTNLGFNNYTAGAVAFGNGTQILTSDATNFWFDDTNDFLGIGTNGPTGTLHLRKDSAQLYSIMEMRSATLGPRLQLYRGLAANADLALNDVVGDIDFVARHNSTSASVADIQGIYTGNGTTRTGDLSFLVSNAGAPAQLARLSGDGTIILGSSYKQLSDGKVTFWGSGPTSSTGRVQIKSGAAFNDTLILEGPSGAFNAGQKYILYADDGSLIIAKQGPSEGNLSIFTTERVSVGDGVPSYKLHLGRGSTNTTLASVSSADPVFCIRSTSATNNNFGMIAFESQGLFLNAGIAGVNEGHLTGSSGHLEFLTRNAGTYGTVATLTSGGNFTPAVSLQDLGTASLRWDLFVGTLNTSLSDGVAYVATNVLATEAQLAITRGGTGQATATLGFNALSPLTTKGDLLTRDGTNNIRLAVGANYGSFPVVDAATSSGLKYGPAIRSGKASIASGVRSTSITFTNNMPSTGYAIHAVLANVTDATPAYHVPIPISQSTSGFSVEWNEVTDTANYVLHWIVMESFA